MLSSSNFSISKFAPPDSLAFCLVISSKRASAQSGCSEMFSLLQLLAENNATTAIEKLIIFLTERKQDGR